MVIWCHPPSKTRSGSVYHQTFSPLWSISLNSSVLGVASPLSQKEKA